MSIAKLHRRAFWLVALLFGCVSWTLAAAPCEFSKAQSKIPVLVAAADTRTADYLVGQLLAKLQETKPQTPIELKSAAAGFPITEIRGSSGYSAPSATGLTEALRDLGLKEQVALVLWNDKSGWIAVVVKPQDETVLSLPVPKATSLPAKRIDSFLQAFAHYYYGNAECAFNAFTKLESDQRETSEAAGIAFWTASALARLGHNDKAISRFRLIESDLGKGGEVDLAVGLLSLPRVTQNQKESRTVLDLLERAAQGFKGKDSRNWATSQIALGRYWLLTSGRTSPEGLIAALRHFDQAEPMLVFPYDAAERANLETLMGMTRLQLGLAVKNSDEHLASALDHFQSARAIWIRIGKEIEAEAVSHQIRYTSELRSRIR